MQNQYPINWALLVKVIREWKPTELRFIETPDGLACQTGSIAGLGVPCVMLARPDASKTSLREEVIALLDKYGYFPVRDEGNGLTVRREMTTVSTAPITPVEIVQYLLREHQPQKLYLSWHTSGVWLELLSTLKTPLYRFPLANRSVAGAVDSYLRECGWRVIGEAASPRSMNTGDRQYER